MRVAIITESFAPDLNGVAHSVVRTAEHLVRRGHQPLVVAPRPAGAAAAPDRQIHAGFDYQVVRVASVPMPGYPAFRIGLPSVRITQALARFEPDVVQLASPFALGAFGLSVARSLDLPTVAVYQTDVARFAAGYRLGFARSAAWRWIRHLHNLADLTLAPSTAAVDDLVLHGVQRVQRWGRGVDAERFHPGRRDDGWRRRIAPNGELIVGYVGRLAPEKHLALLEPVERLPGVRLVLIGAGPDRTRLERMLPAATFLGELDGLELAIAFAGLDLFVHTGAFETFCQTIQEALASGVPVVAPDRGGPRDLVVPGRTGVLVPPHDAVSLVAAVQELVADEPLRRGLATAARDSVAGRTWTAVGDELIEHLHTARAMYSGGEDRGWAAAA